MRRLLVAQYSQLKYIYSNKTYYGVIQAKSEPTCTLRRISGRWPKSLLAIVIFN